MKWLKRILIVLASIILLIVLLNVGLNYWIDRQLPKIINENNNSPYYITYKNLEISLLDRNLHATQVIAVPKASMNSKDEKEGYYVKVKSIDVNGFKLWDLLTSDKIMARSLRVNYPEATLFKGKPKPEKKQKSSNFDYFNKIIYVSDIYVNHGNFGITDITKNRSMLKVSNINFTLEAIFITDETLSKKIPFTYKNYSFDCDSVFYRIPYYSIRTNNVSVTPVNIDIKSPRLIPHYSRKGFVKAIPVEKDLYKINTKDIELNNINWGYKNDRLFVYVNSVIVNNLNANVYRGKMVADDPKKKKLFNRLLRDIKFDLKIDTLRIKNSRIVYEEEKDFAHGPGKISFGQFNLYAVNINSGFGRKKLPDVNIHVRSRFMDISPIKVDWSFNVLDKSDGFRFKGNLRNFPAERLAQFTKPYSNTIAEGDLEEVYFDYVGNDHGARGTFGINYDDLKVKIFRKKDREKKNKVLSAIVNLFVKNDTKEKVKKTDVAVERVPEKSFFNLLWITTAEGLKKILL